MGEDVLDQFASFGLGGVAILRAAETRSISAENPDGAKGGGAKAAPGQDEHCTPAASELGRGWKVRPCIRVRSGERAVLADVAGPGVVQHIWMTVLHERLRMIEIGRAHV